MSKLSYPQKLKPKSKVALIAPAFLFDRERFEQGRIQLETRFDVTTTVLDSAFEKLGYYAGSDERRTAELYHWLMDDSIAAIIGIRGGFGCTKLYPELIRKLKKKKKLTPKILLGSSDLTVLLNGLHQDLGWITFHGPLLSGRPFREPTTLETDTLHQSLFSTTPLGNITDIQTFTLIPGKAKGEIVGGNLTMIVNSIGTPYEIETANKILFLEDVSEAPYRVDRILTHLLHSKKLDRVRGIVFGQMTDCEPTPHTSNVDVWMAVRYALESFLKDRNIPTICNFPAGHGSPQITFPIGTTVELLAHAEKPSVRFLESGVCE